MKAPLSEGLSLAGRASGHEPRRVFFYLPTTILTGVPGTPVVPAAVFCRTTRLRFFSLVFFLVTFGAQLAAAISRLATLSFLPRTFGALQNLIVALKSSWLPGFIDGGPR